MSLKTVQVLYFISAPPAIVFETLTNFIEANGRAMTFVEFQTAMFYLIGYSQLPSDCYELRTEYANQYPEIIGDPSFVTPLIPIPPPSGPALVAHTAVASGPSAVTTLGINTTGATLLVCTIFSYYGNEPLVISDSNGNKWNYLPVSSDASSNCVVSIAYSYGSGVGSSSPLVLGTGHTVTTSDAYMGVVFSAWSGTKTSPVDPYETGTASTNVANSTTVQPGSATPSAVSDLIITAFGLQYSGYAGPATVDSGFTLLDAGYPPVSNSTYAGTAAYLLSTGTAENPTWSSNVTAVLLSAAIAVFAHA